MSVREKLKQQIEIRGTRSPFGKLASDALSEIEHLDAVVLEYNELIRHMDAGGDFFTFQSSRMAKDISERVLSQIKTDGVNTAHIEL